MLRIQMQSAKDRENLVVALANCGYGVRVQEIKIHGSVSSEYYIELLDIEDIDRTLRQSLITKRV